MRSIVVGEVKMDAAISAFVWLVLSAMLVEGVRRVYNELSEALWWIADRTDKCSNKCEFIERRLMGLKMRGHEFVRTMCQDLIDFEPSMDRMWLVRRFGDLISEYIEAKHFQLGGAVALEDLMRNVRFYARIVRMRSETNNALEILR